MANLPIRRQSRTPTRWEPVRELEDMRERMEGLFDDVLRGGRERGGPA